MLDLSLFRNPSFSGANTVMGLVGLAMFGIFFFNSLFLQNVLGYSAIKTGATFLPMTLLIILVAPFAGRFTDRIGPRWPMVAGMTLLTGSLLLFGTLDAQLVVLGHPPRPPGRRIRDGDHDGTDDCRRYGLGARRPGRRRLGGDQQHAPGRRLARDRDHGNARRDAASPSARPAPRYDDQFVEGYHRALQVGAAILFAGAVVAAVTIGRVRRPERAAEAATPETALTPTPSFENVA